MNASLFSHAPDLPERSAPQPALHAETTVPHGTTEAFDGFTDLIHLWWPVESRSVFGEGSHLEFEDRVLAETSSSDEVAVWGEVLAWEPGRGLRLRWHPGRSAAAAGTVDVEFVPSGPETTLVRLTHAGWEQDPDGTARRAEYAAAWPEVLGRYARFMGAGG
jgi:Activator of Hsp90 ATPase homolog 1-like protein